MPNLDVVLGTVNFTDYLRVSAAKVSDPSTEVFIEYINTPITSYALVIPDLEPANYYVNFREAPNTSSLGTLRAQAVVNALTGEWESERRFYTVGSLPSGVTIVGNVLTDPYFSGKTITGVFKEGFRFLELGTDAAQTDDELELLSPDLSFSDGEKLAVELKYNVAAATTTTAAGIFSDTITVTGATYTVLSTNKTKRHCLDAAGATQVITMPPLSSVVTGDYFYFEHKRNGAQAQSKIVFDGTEKVYFNGFDGLTELSELWISKGESLYLRKEGSFWEILFNYGGTRVGERMAATFVDHVNFLPEDGRLLDGDEYPALYWWIRNILPNTHYVTDNGVTSGSYAHPAGKEGLFVIHSTLKKFRLPNTQGLSEKGLADFDSYGADAGRVYDYPGGKQNGQVGEFTENIAVPKGNSYTGSPNNDKFGNGSNNPENRTWTVTFNSGKENRVPNIGVIYLRHI